MPDWVEVAKVEEIPPGTAAVVDANGIEFALVNAGGEFYALAGECSHAGGLLGDGDLVGEYSLECPLHGAVFDVRTGECLKGPAEEPVLTYETLVEGGVVMVAPE